MPYGIPDAVRFLPRPFFLVTNIHFSPNFNESRQNVTIFILYKNNNASNCKHFMNTLSL
jgi:hypothetical protein